MGKDAESNLCEWIVSAEWEITPEGGDYRMFVSVREDGSTDTSDTGFSVVSDTPLHNTMSPLKQIKSGVPLIEVKCDEGKYPAYRHDRMRVACVSEETQVKLIERGWATMRLTNPSGSVAHALCNNYDGKWHQEHEGCRRITDLQCSLMGGKFVDNLRICYDGICPDKGYSLCVTNPDSYTR